MAGNGKKINFISKWGNTENLAGMIPNIGVGIAELVKNSYDADAKTVTVELKGAFEKNIDNCALIISDDGHGMSEEELNHFFTVGHSKNKDTEHRISKSGRIRTGGKGIGRFACKRIAKRVTLVTKAKDNPAFNIVIDWDSHDDSANLQDVQFEYYEGSDAYAGFFPNKESCGTFLILEQFREPMDSTQLQILHRNIQSLVNPFSEIKDFYIDLRVPVSRKKWEDIDTKNMVGFAQYSFIANIDHQGNNVEWKFENNHPWSNDKGEIKSGAWSTRDLLEGEKCSIKVAKIWIYYLGRDPQLTSKYTTKMGRIKKEDIDRLCGFRLYRGKHRVYPYGEIGSFENGDWLGLTRRRQNDNTNWFSHEQLIAAIEINPTANPNLKDMANRTGLADTSEKKQLIDLLRAITKKMKVDLCLPVPFKKPDRLKPPEFHYNMSVLSEVGKTVSEVPKCKFSLPTKWTIKPKLPNGLVLNKATGEISGTSNSAFKTEQFTVVGENEHGEYQFKFWLQVEEKPKIIIDEDQITIDGDDQITINGDDQITIEDDPVGDYKVALRENIVNVKSRLKKLNKSKSVENMLGELFAAKKEIEEMIKSLEN